MLQKMALITALFSILLLVGCATTPQRLGISEQQWQSMSEAKRQEVLVGYQEVRNAPKQQLIVYAGPKIKVQIAEGAVMMPPFVETQPYQAVQFPIKPGECRHISLQNPSAHNHVNLPVCYNGLILSLDPSRYDPQLSNGSLRFNYNPLWKRGFIYQGVSSRGYVRLSKVNVTISALDNIDPPMENVVSQQQPPTNAVQTLEKTVENTPAVPPEPAVESKEKIEKLAPVEDVHDISP